MRIIFQIFFVSIFLLPFTAISQKYTCGIILDSFSLKPVSYATVSTLSTSMYCDSLGYFKLNDSQDDYLIISCIGYNSKRVSIDNDKCDTILLSQAFKELDPVTVRKPDFLNNKKIQLGKLEGKSKFSINVPSGLTILKFFPMPEQSKSNIISELKIRVSHSPDDYEPRKVRVRIFEANAGNILGRDILQLSDIFIIDNIKNKIATLDLSSYGIRMPKNGCFIGIEFIRNGFDNELKSKEYQGWLVIKGWLANSFEDGVVLRSYFNNEFTELLWGSSKKSNIYAALTLFEDAEN